MWQYSVDDPDTISYDANSLLTSTLTNRIGRFRMDSGLISKMVLGVAPNTNLVAIETSAWFTTRDAPYRIGRADLGTVTGNPVCESLGNRYDAPAASQYASGGLRMNGVENSSGTTQSPLTRMLRAHCATIDS